MGWSDIQMQDDHKTYSCILCGKSIKSNHPVKIDDNLDPRHSSYLFDRKECLNMFKRLRARTGENIRDFLKDEQYISDPFWNNVLPTKQEVLELLVMKRIHLLDKWLSLRRYSSLH